MRAMMTRWAMAAAVVGMLAAGQAEAEVTLYLGNEAGFNAAAPGLGFESFEAPFLSGPTIAFSGFTVSALNAVFDPSQATNSSFTPATDGSSVLAYNSQSDGTPTLLTLTFNTTVTAFGIDVIGFGDFRDGSLSVATNTLSVNQTLATAPPISPVPAPPIFFGVVDTAGFNSVTFTTTTAGDLIGIDSVRFGLAPAAVATPEPSTLAMIAAGVPVLLGMGYRRSRRNRSA